MYTYTETNRSSGIRFLDIVREKGRKQTFLKVPDAFVWLSSFALLKKKKQQQKKMTTLIAIHKPII